MDGIELPGGNPLADAARASRDAAMAAGDSAAAAEWDRQERAYLGRSFAPDRASGLPSDSAETGSPDDAAAYLRSELGPGPYPDDAEELAAALDRAAEERGGAAEPPQDGMAPLDNTIPGQDAHRAYYAMKEIAPEAAEALWSENGAVGFGRTVKAAMDYAATEAGRELIAGAEYWGAADHASVVALAAEMGRTEINTSAMPKPENLPSPEAMFAQLRELDPTGAELLRLRWGGDLNSNLEFAAAFSFSFPALAEIGERLGIPYAAGIELAARAARLHARSLDPWGGFKNAPEPRRAAAAPLRSQSNTNSNPRNARSESMSNPNYTVDPRTAAADMARANREAARADGDAAAMKFWDARERQILAELVGYGRVRPALNPGEGV